MKNLFALIVLAVSLPASAQLSTVNGWCEQGAQSTAVSGMNSTNKSQGIIPGCTVTPYLTGTTTLATYYLSPTGSPQTGPFTADTNTGQYLFYAANGICLDVYRSSGTTQTGVIAGGGGGSGGSGTVNAGTTNQIAYYPGNGTTVSGENAVAIGQGGTGATTAGGALTNIFTGASNCATAGTVWSPAANACITGGGSGTVTSVVLTVPSDETVTGSPITSSGTLAVTRNSESANLFLASPSGASGVPSYRAIVAADVPTLNQSTTGNAATATTATSVPYSGLTGTVPTWNQSTTGNAATATALAATPGQCSSGNYATGISAAGTANCGAVQYSQLGGSVPTWNQSTTGNAATATQATNATNVNGGTVSATTGTFSGAVNEPSIVAPASSSATDSASLGPELTTSGTCTGTGWTGTYPTYTPPGTTAPLTCTGFTSGSYYQTVTTLAGNTGGGTLTIVIGTAQVATASGTSGVTTAGLKANGTSLTYTPTAALNGTVTISAKLISPITTFSYQGKDSTGAVSGQMLLQGLGSLNNLFMGGGGIYNTTGYSNTANGYAALYSNTTGYSNTANGYQALNANTTGSDNTANGYQALNFNTDGSNNTANGYQALYANTTGSDNTANGYEALYANTTGFYNTANGYQALFSNTTGSYNTANGTYALNHNTTGSSNTANGYKAGQYIADGVTFNQTSTNSVYAGYQAYPLANGDTNENVIGNAAIGHGSNTTTLGNSATVGTWLNGTVYAVTVAAGTTTPTTMGSNGVLLNGVPALQSQTSLYNYYSGGAGNLTGTGIDNAANGYQALQANTTGYSNTANGYQALNFNTDGSNNTANGYQALYYNTTGYSNTANGYQALNHNTTGSNNTANGIAALFFNTTGNNNTANGYAALQTNTTGSDNTANGYEAGEFSADGVTSNQTSNFSVYEGYQAYPLANGDTNENVIGNAAIGHGSNTTTLGNSATVGTWLNGTQHITATAPTASAGTIAAYSTNAGGEITSLSAATSVTITFANSGWTNAAFCVANSSVAATQPYVTAQSNTAVTFTFPALTGNLFYHCDGN